MTLLSFLLLVLAGVGGGLTGSIAGLASLVTFPALLAVGLPPVAANVTNTVGLVFTGVGSFLGSRKELRGQGRWLLGIAPVAVVGGVIGAVLLLTTPAEGFERLVPFLLGFASLTILLPRGRAARAGHPQVRRTGALVAQAVALFLITIYGGYFGAAAGVLLLALLLRTRDDDLPRANAAKNAILAVANTVAAIIFIVVAPVDWGAVIPLGIGCLIGSRIGPVVVRSVPVRPLRYLIGAAGFALAITLGFRAFG
ncbi:sulfite exporter TauE/SafE family protein [Nakamurella flava]|uniref:Probable membrane transporter protein n=1 Tax=Nakamurella flava TaxID=2576308 RepID=A0A4U6QIY7_9ACTN|nr:sulfite exporter TauE/SafE family protein [Nakamurella flava]TKV60363.1 sulfite exporter TauE/SafE family protein [Nakamurella flava]